MGHRRSRQRSPQSLKPAVGPVLLGPTSGRLVLLGLIAAEGARRCKIERDRQADALEKVIAGVESVRPELADKWEERRAVWRPVSCDFDFFPSPAPTTEAVAAPAVTFAARPDKGAAIVVRFSICMRGLIRVQPLNWPNAPAPTTPKDPTNIAEAIEWSRRIVDRTLPPLFAHVDPFVDPPIG
jgi:hypothetical protein